MKKALKILGIILLIIIIIIGIIVFMLWQTAKSMGIGGGEVADYERKVNIWNNVAGNSSKSKLDDMNINYKSNSFSSTLFFGKAIVNKNYEDKERDIDTFTYFYEIKSGFEKETYEDEPYLIPYLVDNSDSAVIVIPGGGFGYKSMDGSNGEGKEIAETLNKNGINAFVLHYRSNPYEYPIPYLDLQRAIKYIKYHDKDYGIDKNKVSIIGFSAGGNLVANHINVFQNNDYYPENYIKDEIDGEDATINYAAMIYPALSFNYNVPMLFTLFDADDVRDNNKRNELLDLMDMTKQFNSSNVNQFIAYGLKDTMVGFTEAENYITKAEKNNTNIKKIIVKKGNHGFKQENYMNEYINWFNKQINK